MGDRNDKFITTVSLPGGMDAYNVESKRFVRWRKGHQHPTALATEDMPVPKSLFLNRKYIYWNALGYYEMGLKDSSDYRAKCKLKVKRSIAEVNQSNVNHSAINYSQDDTIELDSFSKKVRESFDPSLSPLPSWEIDRSRTEYSEDLSDSHSDTVQTLSLEHKDVLAQPSTAVVQLQRSTRKVLRKKKNPGSNSPQPQPLQPQQQWPTHPTASPFKYPIEAPVPVPVPCVYSYSSQTVTHTLTVPPPPLPLQRPLPILSTTCSTLQLTQPKIPLGTTAPPNESTQLALPTSTPASTPITPTATESVPWYITHTPASTRTFCKGDRVRVTAGTFVGCKGQVKGPAQAGSKVLQGQLKVRVEKEDGTGCTVFIAVASLDPLRLPDVEEKKSVSGGGGSSGAAGKVRDTCVKTEAPQVQEACVPEHPEEGETSEKEDCAHTAAHRMPPERDVDSPPLEPEPCHPKVVRNVIDLSRTK